MKTKARCPHRWPWFVECLLCAEEVIAEHMNLDAPVIGTILEPGVAVKHYRLRFRPYDRLYWPLNVDAPGFFSAEHYERERNAK